VRTPRVENGLEAGEGCRKRSRWNRIGET